MLNIRFYNSAWSSIKIPEKIKCIPWYLLSMLFFNEKKGNFDYLKSRYLSIKTRKLVLGICVKFREGGEGGEGKAYSRFYLNPHPPLEVIFGSYQGGGVFSEHSILQKIGAKIFCGWKFFHRQFLMKMSVFFTPDLNCLFLVDFRNT